MKVIIAGTRSVIDYAIVERAVLNSEFDITEVVSGGCAGPDLLGERWAEEHGIAVKRFPAKWDLLGQSAGPIRNSQMVEYADALIAIWDGVSSGTGNVLAKARRNGLDIHVERL